MRWPITTGDAGQFADVLAQPGKINSPITDNLFELRREVVDEAHGGKLAAAWQAQQQARFEQIMAAALAGRDQLCFVEVESAYWLRQRFSEMAEITLVTPSWDEIAKNR
jgi:hypothetical protein